MSDFKHGKVQSKQYHWHDSVCWYFIEWWLWGCSYGGYKCDTFSQWKVVSPTSVFLELWCFQYLTHNAICWIWLLSDWWSHRHIPLIYYPYPPGYAREGVIFLYLCVMAYLVIKLFYRLWSPVHMNTILTCCHGERSEWRRYACARRQTDRSTYGIWKTCSRSDNGSL